MILELDINDWTEATLEALSTLGPFGSSKEQVAEELLRAKLREIEMEGWFEKSKSWTETESES